MPQLVDLPYKHYQGPTKFSAVSNGKIYIGEPDLDPRDGANQIPVTIRQENGTEVAASQPITTDAGGFAQYNGSPVQLIVDESYSIAVDDANDNQIHYASKVDVAGTVSEYGSAVGTPGSYIVTISSITAYGAGGTIRVEINADNPGASTIDVNSFGPRSILNANGSELGKDQLRAGGVYTMVDDGSAYRLQNNVESEYFAVTTGSADTYVATGIPIADYRAGTKIHLQMHASNTTASTVDVGFGARSIVNKNGSALSGGQLLLNGIYELFDDGTNYQLLSATEPATQAEVDAGTDANKPATSLTVHQKTDFPNQVVTQSNLEQPDDGSTQIMSFFSSTGQLLAYPSTYSLREFATPDQVNSTAFRVLKSGTVTIDIDVQQNGGGTAFIAIDRFSPDGTRTQLVEHSSTSASFVTKSLTVSLTVGDVIKLNYRQTGTSTTLRNGIVKADKLMFVFG